MGPQAAQRGYVTCEARRFCRFMTGPQWPLHRRLLTGRVLLVPGRAVLEVASPAFLSAESLLEQVWDEHADPFTNTVAVTIGRLRRTLGDPPMIRTTAGWICSVPGAAQLLAANAAQSPKAVGSSRRFTAHLLEK